MKRLIALTIAILLLPVLAYAQLQFMAGSRTTTVLTNVTGRIDAATDSMAFLWIDGTDLSGYVETGGKRCRISIYDTTNGKWLVGFAGAVGAGETLGADVLSGWDFTSGWSTTVSSAIDDSNSFTTTAGNVGVYSSIILTDFACYYGTMNASTSASSVRLTTNHGAPIWISSLGPLANLGYGSITTSPAAQIRNMSSGTTDVTSMTLQRVTDPPATALRIHSSPTGATRGWLRADSGFGYNLTNLRIIIDKP